MLDSVNKATRLFNYLFCLLILFFLNGCSILELNTMKNEQIDMNVKPEKPVYNQEDPFIGIAMSGGGSRATNFSAAVLKELEKLGILQHVNVISSVSGSSLTAAYYGLYANKNNQDHPWTDEGVRQAFIKDFLSSWVWNWFNPWNVFRYWLSNFNRSDIMIETLNAELYDDRQFKELIGHTPQIIINATSYTNGQPFIFTPDYFAHRLNSALDTYPVANAVMASSAFPGVFQPVTVKDYSLKAPKSSNVNNDTQYYEHLIDGGPYDNLGLTSIINILHDSKPKNCLLIVIDAYPYPETAEHILEADTRNPADYVFDSGTVISSTDILLANNRTLIMEKAINFDGPDIGFKAFNPHAEIKFSHSENNTQTCTVWHLSFQRLHDLQFQWTYARRNINEIQFIDRVRKIVNSIPTNYRLEENEAGDTPETVQDYIFKAANILVKQDKECQKLGNECENDKFTYQNLCALLVNQWGFQDIASSCR